MNKLEIIQFLDNHKIPYEITEHEAVYNMAELANVELPYPEFDAKNLFVRDDKKLHYYLITVKGDKRVDLKEFRKKHGTRPLTFASDEELLFFLGLEKGAVTPLGLLNDKESNVEFFLDDSFLESPGIVGVHPNENTATVWLNSKDLLLIISEHGNRIHVVTI